MIEDSHDGADYVDGGAAGGGGEGTESGAVHIYIICNLSSSLLSYICVLVAKRRRAPSACQRRMLTYADVC